MIIAVIEALVRRHWEYTVALFEAPETVSREELEIRQPRKAQVFFTRKAANNYAAKLLAENPEVTIIEYNRRKVR